MGAFVVRNAVLIAKRCGRRIGARSMRAMKTSTLIMLSILLGSSAMYRIGAQASQTDSAHSEIAARSASFTGALAQGDAAKAARIFSTDGRLSVSGSAVLEGREAIEKFWQGALASGMKSLTLDARDLEGTGDLRVETGSYAAFGANHVEIGRGEYLLVWKRVDAAWQIHRDYAHATGPVAAMNPHVIDSGLPRDYATAMRRVRGTAFDENSGLTTVFANDAAASTVGFSQQRYPEGAVIIMEFAEPQRDGEGELLRDAQGALLKGAILHVDVMRRAAEWEYASYGPDGSVLDAPDKAGHCAACHRSAGASRDFVFRRRQWE
jgi:ketosteroid isomerase-like protein